MTVAAAFAIETVGHPLAGLDRRAGPLAARAAAYLMLYAGWFSVAWRPWLAATAAIVTVAVLRAISETKRRLVAEPLVFSDVALLGQVVRHPDLYYVDARALLVAAAVVIPVAVWLAIEPSLLPRRPDEALAALMALPAAEMGLAILLRRPAGAAARRLAPAPALTRDEARLGVLLTLLVYLFRWSDLRRGGVPIADAAPEAPLSPRVVVVVQLESFVDPATLPGGAAGPGLARARAGALAHGRLSVPGHGAYTMRSEFAVLTGLEAEGISFEGFDPYLSVAGRPFATLATALRDRGYATVFVHPFRRAFFGRDRVMPSLGFSRLVMEDAFPGAERIGRYVSDSAVADRILAEVDRARGPALVFAATMQNHGPWNVPLKPDPGTPLGRYRRHLADADLMIGRLLDGLDARDAPGLLCLYGDHPPILDGFGPGSGGPSTTYAVVATGPGAGHGPGEARDLSAAGLGRLIKALSAAP